MTPTPGTGKIQRARAPLVGSGERVQAAPPDQPAALEWIARIAKLAGASALDMAAAAGFSPRRMARRGARSRDDLPTSAEGRAAAPARSKLAVDYEAISARISPRAHRRLRRRHLHGAARARADPASTVRACSRLAKRRTRVLLDDQPQLKSYLLAVIGAEYVLSCSPRARTTTRNSSSLGAGAPLPRAGLERREMTGMTTTRSPGSTRSGRHRDVNYLLLRAQ